MPHTPSEDYKELQDFIENDRQKTQIRDKARAEPGQQERDWQPLVDATARIRDYLGPLGDRKWVEDRYEHLVGLRNAFEKAGKGEALDKLPEHGNAQQIVAALLKLVKAGDHQQSLELLQSIQPTGELARELANHWKFQLPQDLQGVLIPLPPAFDFLLGFHLNAAQFHTLEKLSARWQALSSKWPALLSPEGLIPPEAQVKLQELQAHINHFAAANRLIPSTVHRRPMTDNEHESALMQFGTSSGGMPLNAPVELTGDPDVDACNALQMALFSIETLWRWSNLEEELSNNQDTAAKDAHSLLRSSINHLDGISTRTRWKNLEAWKHVAEFCTMLAGCTETTAPWRTTWLAPLGEVAGDAAAGLQVPEG